VADANRQRAHYWGKFADGPEFVHHQFDLRQYSTL
jgi:hypothetical protein